MQDWNGKIRWLKEQLLEKGKQLEKLLREKRERLVPAAVFLALSLALLIVANLLLPSPATRVAGRYLDAAFAYDYTELYSLFDQAVLEGELERYGLDRSGMAAVAQLNSAQVEQYVALVESGCAVDISYTYELTGERALEPDELEALRGRYAADGFQVDILGARRVSAQVSTRLAGGGHWEVLERELELTAICTPSGWSLDRDSMHVYLAVIYDLPAFAQEHFGT